MMPAVAMANVMANVFTPCSSNHLFVCYFREKTKNKGNSDNLFVSNSLPLLVYLYYPLYHG